MCTCVGCGCCHRRPVGEEVELSYVYLCRLWFLVLTFAFVFVVVFVFCFGCCHRRVCIFCCCLCLLSLVVVVAIGELAVGEEVET